MKTKNVSVGCLNSKYFWSLSSSTSTISRGACWTVLAGEWAEAAVQGAVMPLSWLDVLHKITDNCGINFVQLQQHFLLISKAFDFLLKWFYLIFWIFLSKDFEPKKKFLSENFKTTSTSIEKLLTSIKFFNWKKCNKCNSILFLAKKIYEEAKLEF